MLRSRTARAYPWSAARAVWLLLSAVEILIALRLVLLLLAANPGAGFVRFVYDITAPLVAPFAGMFQNHEVSGGVLEVGSLVAMLVYWAAAWVVVRLLAMLSTPRRRLLA